MKSILVGDVTILTLNLISHFLSKVWLNIIVMLSLFRAVQSFNVVNYWLLCAFLLGKENVAYLKCNSKPNSKS